jgi:hypothetical protein
MDTIEPGDWESLNAAVQKIVKAHNKMRRRIEALEATAESLAGASASTQTSTGPAPGVFVPDLNCKSCGKSKRAGRTALTCDECAAARQTILKTPGADRTPITFSACVNCAIPKKYSTTMLCTPCSGAFKQWKIDQKA